jgi:hypothetical protein
MNTADRVSPCPSRTMRGPASCDVRAVCQESVRPTLTRGADSRDLVVASNTPLSAVWPGLSWQYEGDLVCHVDGEATEHKAGLGRKRSDRVEPRVQSKCRTPPTQPLAHNYSAFRRGHLDPTTQPSSLPHRLPPAERSRRGYGKVQERLRLGNATNHSAALLRL